MKDILLESAKEKMVLAKDIAHPGGSDLLPICRKGTELTQVLIERLTEMGIQSLCVKERPVKLERDDDLQERLDALDDRFKRLDGNQRMMKLKEITRRQLLRSMENDHGE
ncbi:MAG: hypothetical protein ABGX83_05100 [Nitrospira sp.]|nr:hypothetical protein [Candidatus Manganitrophaceae bacterium]HIL34824.1 hypothetical protein [Candidatus Manganitrophaceae bacterium]